MLVKVSNISGVITTLVLLNLCLLAPGNAQTRYEDRIVTIQKDTLRVKITEFGLTSLRYKNIAGDTATIHTISKKEIKTVLFGNGDIEHFAERADEVYTPTETQYYRAVRKTSFQREIATWPTDQLIGQKTIYKQKYISQKIGGVTSIVVGSGIAIFGMGQLINSIFDSDDGAKGTIAFLSGITVATGVGIPLTIFGAKTKRKYRAIEAEMYRRGL